MPCCTHCVVAFMMLPHGSLLVCSLWGGALHMSLPCVGRLLRFCLPICSAVAALAVALALICFCARDAQAVTFVSLRRRHRSTIFAAVLAEFRGWTRLTVEQGTGCFAPDRSLHAQERLMPLAPPAKLD